MRLSRLVRPYHIRNAWGEAENIFFDFAIPFGFLIVVAHFTSLLLFAGGKWESWVWPFTAASFTFLLWARVWVMDHLFAEKRPRGLKLRNPDLAQVGGVVIPSVAWIGLTVILLQFL